MTNLENSKASYSLQIIIEVHLYLLVQTDFKVGETKVILVFCIFWCLYYLFLCLSNIAVNLHVI